MLYKPASQPAILLIHVIANTQVTPWQFGSMGWIQWLDASCWSLDKRLLWLASSIYGHPPQSLRVQVWNYPKPLTVSDVFPVFFRVAVALVATDYIHNIPYIHSISCATVIIISAEHSDHWPVRWIKPTQQSTRVTRGIVSALKIKLHSYCWHWQWSRTNTAKLCWYINQNADSVTLPFSFEKYHAHWPQHQRASPLGTVVKVHTQP